MQLPDPAAAGLISVATPRTAAPGARSTAAAAPTARTLMPMAASLEWVVELREPQDVAAVERRLTRDEDGECDRVRRLGALAVPHAAPVPSAADGHGRRARSEVAVGLLDRRCPGLGDVRVVDLDRLPYFHCAELEPLVDGRQVGGDIGDQA